MTVRYPVWDVSISLTMSETFRFAGIIWSPPSVVTCLGWSPGSVIVKGRFFLSAASSNSFCETFGQKGWCKGGYICSTSKSLFEKCFLCSWCLSTSDPSLPNPILLSLIYSLKVLPYLDVNTDWWHCVFSYFVLYFWSKVNKFNIGQVMLQCYLSTIVSNSYTEIAIFGKVLLSCHSKVCPL